jgi:hypothetical protein
VVDVPQPRVFHHKGGGPCDHCGVMGEWCCFLGGGGGYRVPGGGGGGGCVAVCVCVCHKWNLSPVNGTIHPVVTYRLCNGS